MILRYRIKRRILNGLALQYTRKDLSNILLGYIYSIASPNHTKADHLKIDLRKIPCFVISLPFRHDRRINITNYLRNNLTFHFINAIHGRDINLSELSEELFSSNSKKYLSKGSIGCTLSHLRAWEIAEEVGAKACLFLEDDVIIKYDVDSINSLLREVPIDYDIIFLGSSNTHLLRTKNCINNHFIETIYPRRGMFAYILKIKSIDKIFNN